MSPRTTSSTVRFLCARCPPQHDIPPQHDLHPQHDSSCGAEKSYNSRAPASPHLSPIKLARDHMGIYALCLGDEDEAVLFQRTVDLLSSFHSAPPPHCVNLIGKRCPRPLQRAERAPLRNVEDVRGPGPSRTSCARTARNALPVRPDLPRLKRSDLLPSSPGPAHTRPSPCRRQGRGNRIIRGCGSRTS